MKRLYEIGILPYTILLLYMMFFASGRTEFTIGFLQPNPFQTIRHFLVDDVELQGTIVNILGNILLFSPFGFLGLRFKRLNNIALLTTTFMLAIICIELTQYFTARGTADIDDFFLNTIGMMLGYYIYCQIKIHYPQYQKKQPVQINKKLVLGNIKA